MRADFQQQTAVRSIMRDGDCCSFASPSASGHPGIVPATAFRYGDIHCLYPHQ